VSLTTRSGALVAVVSLCTAPVVSGQTPAAPPRAPKVTGYLQGRFQSIGDSALFLLRRARLGAEGNLTTWATYKLQAELRTGGTGATATTVGATDLYLGLAHGQWSGRVGQFKTPFSRELLQGDDQGELPERSVVVDSLAPSRDVGFMAEWTRVRRLTVQGGVFNGEGFNRAQNRDKRMLYVGRAVFVVVRGVEVGGAAAAFSDSTRWDVELALERGGWFARAEYLRQDRRTPADHRDGWYALTTYTFRPQRAQLVGRVEQFDPGATPGNTKTGYTLGAQYFFRGDDLKLVGAYTVFTEQGTAVSDNRVIVQMQARW